MLEPIQNKVYHEECFGAPCWIFRKKQVLPVAAWCGQSLATVLHDSGKLENFPIGESEKIFIGRLSPKARRKLAARLNQK